MISQIGYERKFLTLYKYKSLLTLYMCFKIVIADLDKIRKIFTHYSCLSFFIVFLSFIPYIYKILWINLKPIVS